MTYPMTASELNTTSAATSALRWIATVASAALLLVAAGPQAATAQNMAPPTDDVPRWTKTFQQQVATLLESGNADMQARGLQLIVEFGERDEYAFDFRSMRPQIYEVLLDHNNADNLRIMALSALHATGPTPGNRILVASIQDEPSPRVQRFILRMLVAEKKNTF